MPSAHDIRMAELHEEMALLERKVTEEAEKERIVKEAEEAQLAKLEEGKRIAEEERKRREEEEQRQAEEQQQAAIALAKYQRNAEQVEAKKVEAERIEAAKAAFKKREDADVEFRKATVKVQRETKAKARKEAAAAKSGSEKAEGLGKRGREEISVTVGSFLTAHGVEWMVKEEVVCESCEKKERKCFWRMEAGQGKACLACHNLKKSCSAGGAEELEAEAGPSKKRRVEGKEKAATPNSRVVESAMTDVLRDILEELKGLCVEVGDLRAFSQRTTTVAENSWRTQWQIGSCVADLRWHFMLDNGKRSVRTEDEEEGRVEAEDKEDGEDRAENEEMRDTEMEESGTNMADNTMDDTLH